MKKVSSIILLGSILLTIIINLIFLNQLPEKVGLQINLNGNVNNQIGKTYFIFVAPIILLINYLINRYANDENNKKAVGVAIVVFVLNIVTLIFNI